MMSLILFLIMSGFSGERVFVSNLYFHIIYLQLKFKLKGFWGFGVLAHISQSLAVTTRLSLGLERRSKAWRKYPNALPS